ncbi:hypothetical protein ARMSODRAFT_960708 [Armillaria solidipes]|uniref:Uncharacterized protein n=1 Tax=Armillaria solidipes TaxID=1076256 RepID=A0A2H3BML7_9AGAR|nr:hypothetical protein ARMSODRAFT_960708 [Armillaria solidipes]
MRSCTFWNPQDDKHSPSGFNMRFVGSSTQNGLLSCMGPLIDADMMLCGYKRSTGHFLRPNTIAPYPLGCCHDR